MMLAIALGFWKFATGLPSWVRTIIIAMLVGVVIWNAGVNRGRATMRAEWVAAEVSTLKVVEEAKARAEDEIPPLTVEDRIADRDRPGVGIPCRVYDPYDRDCKKDRKGAH